MDTFHKNDIGISLALTEAIIVRDALRLWADGVEDPGMHRWVEDVEEMAEDIDEMIRRFDPEGHSTRALESVVDWVPGEPDEPTVGNRGDVGPKVDGVTICSYCGHRYPEGYAAQAGVIGVVNTVRQWYCSKRCRDDHEVAKEPVEDTLPPIADSDIPEDARMVLNQILSDIEYVIGVDEEDTRRLNRFRERMEANGQSIETLLADHTADAVCPPCGNCDHGRCLHNGGDCDRCNCESYAPEAQ